ncbi:MAG: glycosyltransferase [Bryobacteraceae bacterium]|nr:glycosyltransferase [Bryobacteraceae bacterium]
MTNGPSKSASFKGRIHILVPTFQPHDAVGNDAAGMYHVLRAAGYDARLFAQHIHAAYASITTIANASDSSWDDPKALLIYHHAIDWELGEEILRKTKNTVAIKYHNVTPPNFFANYSEFYYWACVRGREANQRLAQLPNTWVWGDSQYNTDEFVQLGHTAERARVVAPLHHVEDLMAEPFDNVITGAFRDSANILFVGGMRPNKGHAKALETIVALREQTSLPIRLFLVGNFDSNLARYTDDLHEYMRHLDLGDEVFFARSVDGSQLRSYYMASSVFLCVSEHEGFCVPLVEAMAFRVPIVAWATTAVGETAGDSGIIYNQFDPHDMAAGIAQVIENPDLGRELSHRGRKRYEEVFHIQAIKRQLISLVEEAMQK